MSDIAIHVEKLGKLYQIGKRQNVAYQTLRDTLSGVLTAPFRRAKQNGGSDSSGETFWALKDVSFEVKEGEVVGVIGRNGAGKSTLLKILSRITEPTEGFADIQGRVASLLEVGTGFHAELTGRENVYLNGAILGMKKAEIDRKFDEIVSFAEIEKFIDTPVKHYSTGMYLRLAFAVAAHLEPEILLVDEVLAVGDAQFQQKCLGQINNMASQGRTVLFVSHNMSAIQHLCRKAILLKSGYIVGSGQVAEVIGQYLSDAQTENRISIRDWSDRSNSGEARLVQFEVTDGAGQPTTRFPLGSSIRFTLHAEVYDTIIDPCFGVIIHNSLGEPILDLRSLHDGMRIGRTIGNVIVEARVDNLGLYPGRYFLSPWISDAGVKRDIDFVKLCATIEVEPAPGPHGDLRLSSVWGKYHVQSNWVKQR